MESCKPILVIMAAGLGNRYGGLKQMEGVGPSGELILDYSLFDAKRAGFERAVIIINPKNEAAFRERLGDRVAKHMQVDYAYQDIEDLPEGIQVPPGRTKPWGTGHATLSAAHLVDAPFCAINADDYYGAEAFRLCYEHLCNLQSNNDLTMVGYLLKNTLSESGSVSRGVCTVDSTDHLETVVERTSIFDTPEGPLAKEKDDTQELLSPETVVSMNMWGFPQAMMGHLRQYFTTFLREEMPLRPTDAEFYLPTVVNGLLHAGEATVRVYTTPDKWYGITYPKDRQDVVDALRRMTAEHAYPAPLWGENGK